MSSAQFINKFGSKYAEGQTLRLRTRKFAKNETKKRTKNKTTQEDHPIKKHYQLFFKNIEARTDDEQKHSDPEQIGNRGDGLKNT